MKQTKFIGCKTPVLIAVFISILAITLAHSGYSNQNTIVSACFNSSVLQQQIWSWNGTNNNTVLTNQISCAGGCNNVTGLCNSESTTNFSWFLLVALIVAIGFSIAMVKILDKDHPELAFLFLILSLLFVYFMFIQIGSIGEQYKGGVIAQNSNLALQIALVFFGIVFLVIFYFMLRFIIDMINYLRTKRMKRFYE